MDIGKAFTFVFDDKDWIVKILIAAAILLVGVLFSWLLLIPLLAAAALISGFSLEITRRVIRGNPDALPAWDNWGVLIVDGLKVIVIGIVYALPAIVVSLCLGIPIGLLSDSSSAGAAAFGAFLSFGLSMLTIVWAIFISFVLPAAIGTFADTGELRDAFRFGDVWNLVRNNLGTYAITMLMTWVAGVVGSLGVILCGIGLFATMPYSEMVAGHLYGQAYVTARGKMAHSVVEPLA